MVTVTQPVIIRAYPPESRARRDIARPRNELPATALDGRRRNSRLFLGCLVVVGISLAAFCLVKRPRTHAVAPYISPAGEQTEVSPSHIKITSLTPEGTKSVTPPKGLLHYKNKETRDIVWSDDGLPTRVTIEREYYQLP